MPSPTGEYDPGEYGDEGLATLPGALFEGERLYRLRRAPPPAPPARLPPPTPIERLGWRGAAVLRPVIGLRTTGAHDLDPAGAAEGESC